MNTISTTRSGRLQSGLIRVLQAFAQEAIAFFDAITSPGKIIAEVEHMRALQLQADRVAATDPAHAAALRQQAALTGMR